MVREYKNIDAKLKESLENAFGDKVKVENPRPHRLNVTVSRDDALEVVKHLNEKHGLTYVSTITGVDAIEHYEVIYHFFLENTVINLKAIVPKEENPWVHSIYHIIPGADLYERENKDLLGIYPKGHPDPSRQTLPEDWPEGDYPLRKDWPAKERGIR
ncbi:MAG: NADH-quinone oxidoreductase subunit C [Clostridia bacterium]|nr:NADH-quinone oxidoreductase subunit C [Clostridia bacterium]